MDPVEGDDIHTIGEEGPITTKQKRIKIDVSWTRNEEKEIWLQRVYTDSESSSAESLGNMRDPHQSLPEKCHEASFEEGIDWNKYKNKEK